MVYNFCNKSGSRFAEVFIDRNSQIRKNNDKEKIGTRIYFKTFSYLVCEKNDTENISRSNKVKDKFTNMIKIT